MSEPPETNGERSGQAPASSGAARQVLDALSRGDVDAFARLLHPEVEIHTSKGVRRGIAEAREWASRTYDHLDRRYEVEELHVTGESVLALAQVQYVWRESGEVGDSVPVAVELDFEQGKLRRWRLHDDQAMALKVFAPAVE
ncbi:MAG TPA: nuclear transport factor 2 family protein [Solirubrobacterales bacterium]|nr:nuclear transport factor 2 family protein [Solirubrobacterales bacterium]